MLIIAAAVGGPLAERLNFASLLLSPYHSLLFHFICYTAVLRMKAHLYIQSTHTAAGNHGRIYLWVFGEDTLRALVSAPRCPKRPPCILQLPSSGPAVSVYVFRSCNLEIVSSVMIEGKAI